MDKNRGAFTRTDAAASCVKQIGQVSGDSLLTDEPLFVLTWARPSQKTAV